MWRSTEVNTRIDQPVDRVFAYLVDPMRWHEFAPAVVMRRPIDDGRLRVGSRWRSADRIGPFTFRFIDELAVLEPNRRVVWLSSAPWNARTEYVCSPDGGGTRIRARYEGDMAGWLRLLGAVPPPVMGWILGQDFRRLGRLLAAQASASAAPLPEPAVLPGLQEDMQ
jgi:uncharacterized protein YndB with AHSA1/START domain